MFVTLRPKTFTFTFTAMETLTSPVIPSDLHEHFLEFSSKEEYLKKRAEWRAIYKWLSVAIRHNKRVDKASARAVSLIEHRMVKSGKLPGHGCAYHLRYYCSTGRLSKETFEEFDARRKAAEANIPKRIGIGGLDATDLLKIRQIMKEKSCAQRGLS